MKARTYRRFGLVIAAIVTITATLNLLGCADWFVLPPQAQCAAEGTTRRVFRYRDGDNQFTAEAYSARAAGAANVEPRAFVLRFTGGDAPGAAAYTATRWKNRPVEYGS